MNGEDAEYRGVKGLLDKSDGGPLGAGIVRAQHKSETDERIAADKRRRAIRAGGMGSKSLAAARGDLNLINMAIAGLCEAVRDYAIFVMDPEGVIVYWGMGAHLMKWWTPEEAEGAHLRLLYPENGSEDGTAEGHLFEAAATGEYVGEGQRVRRGGSTFWAHVVLTALRDPQGQLLGFAKVTQDLTKRRALESAMALANEAESSREAALMTAEEALLAQERADQARLRAEAALEKSQQAAAFAREQARSAQEHIARILGPAVASQGAEQVSFGVELDAYIDVFKRGDLQEDGGQSET